MPTTKMTKLTILFCLLIASGLTQGKTDIEFWTTQTQSDRIKIINTLVMTFEAINPDIDIQVVPVDENDVAMQMAAAAAANNLPDMIEAGSELLLSFGEEGVVDKTSNRQLIHAIGEQRFFTGALNMLRAPNGEDFYGIPMHGWIQGIWYRKDWFAEAGLAPPTNWAAIEQAAKALTVPEKNQYGILIGTQVDSYTEQVFTHFALSNNAHQFNADGELVFNSPAMLETLNYYQRLAQYNPPGPQSWRARDYYLQGKMAMFFYSTFIMDDLALAEVAKSSLTSENFSALEGAQFDKDLVKNTGFVPIISHKSAASYGVMEGITVLSGNPAATEAVQTFIKFLYDPYAYVTYLHMAPGGMNPMLADIPEHPYFLKDPKGIFERYGAAKISEIIAGFNSIQSFAVVNGRAFPKSGQIFAKQIIPQMIYSVIFEEVAPKAALDKAESAMQAVITEQ